MLTGYCDRLTATPGTAITVHVSTDAPFADIELVRPTRPAVGPGRPLELPVQRIEGTRQRVVGLQQRQARSGSFGFAERESSLPPLVSFAAWVWLAAATPGRLQGVLAHRDADRGDGVALALDEEGRPCALAGDVRLTAARPLPLRTWCLLVAGFDQTAGELRLSVVPSPRAPEHLRRAVSLEDATFVSSARVLLAAAGARTSDDSIPEVDGLFNGKLERPFVCEGLLDAQLVEDLAADSASPDDLPVLHYWDLGHDTDSARALDVAPAANHLTLVNAPTLGMTGHRFTGLQLSPATAPEQYGGAHFHDDDLDDVRWSPTAVIEVPESLASGLYAVRLETDGEADHILVCVSPRRDTAQGTADKAVFLVSTMTLLAYANARVPGLASAPGALADDRTLNRLFDEHPEWGSSLYDFHTDGSGVCLATTRRPISGLRPDYWSRVSETPGLLGGHLAVIEWLDRSGVDYDVITDHDLHSEGAGLLAGYRALVTSPHPEYVTEEMLDAITEYQRGGGSFMYLGGNGFYWVTSVSPSRPHLLEVRRSHSGSRAWSNEPGEDHHATTGVPGGLWRHRGRSPQNVAGIGMAALGSEESNPGYRSLPAAFDPRARFVFEGVDVPVPGTSVFLDGAAGGEVDRVDSRLGTPVHALRVATSEGLHEDTFTTATEDLLILEPGMGLGSSDPRVRSDVVFYETGFGGAVFSVGSIAWCSQLPAKDYDNDVARVTTNVLRRFVDPVPFTVDL